MKNNLYLIKKGFFTEMNLGFSVDISIKNYAFKNNDKVLAKKICDYLKKGTVIAACFGISKDIFDENKVSGDQSLLTDGKYVWPNNLAYYVEEYGVEIDNEFLEFMIKNNWTNSFSASDLQNMNVYIDGQKIF